VSQLDDAFTCHGQSWSGECRTCADIDNALNRGNDQGWVTEYEKEYADD
jgi:hypothetical protein